MSEKLNWTREEDILALDLYHRRGLLDKRDPDVLELSRLLRAMRTVPPGVDPEKFRNPTGVSMKLANFRALDPDVVPLKGLSSVSDVDRKVWAEFVNRWDDLASAAADIRARITSRAPTSSDAARGTQSLALADSGYEDDPLVRRAIELKAMASAVRYFCDLGYAVTDVSATESYDLRCSSGTEVIHVEVKGTRGSGDQVILTANEVEHARSQYPMTALFIESHMQLQQTADAGLAVIDGQCRVLHPWRIDDARLVPTQYRYALPPLRRSTP